MSKRFQASLMRLMAPDDGADGGSAGGSKTDAATQTSGEDGKSTDKGAGTGSDKGEGTQTSDTEGKTGTKTDGSTASGGKIELTPEQQAFVDRMVQQRLNEDRAKRAEETKRKQAEEQGQFKALYEQEQKKREEAEAKVAQAERAALISRVAGKHHLPEEMHDRLRGETEAELEADAKKMAALLKPKAPDTEAGKRNGAGLKAGAGAASQGGQEQQQQRRYGFQGQHDVAWPTD